MLNKAQGLAEKADYSSLKSQILPRAQRLCAATTSAGVRQAAFRALTALAPRFDKEVALEFVATTQQVYLLTIYEPAVKPECPHPNSRFGTTIMEDYGDYLNKMILKNPSQSKLLRVNRLLRWLVLWCTVDQTRVGPTIWCFETVANAFL